MHWDGPTNGTHIKVQGDPGDLRTAVSKYSRQRHQVFAGPSGRVGFGRRAGRKARSYCACAIAALASPPRNWAASSAAFTACRGARRPKVKGTGLGLFIVRAVAKAHGGRVFAESAGEGRRHDRHNRIAKEQRMSRILVVEDEAHLAKGLRFNLEAEGYASQSWAMARPLSTA